LNVIFFLGDIFKMALIINVYPGRKFTSLVYLKENALTHAWRIFRKYKLFIYPAWCISNTDYVVNSSDIVIFVVVSLHDVFLIQTM